MAPRIFKIIATSGFLKALECTKSVFGRGSVPDPAEEAYSATPDPIPDLRGPTSEGRGKGEENRVEKVRKKEGKARERSLS